MSARAQRTKNRRIKLVGGGFRYSRTENSAKPGGSAKAIRRAMRKEAKKESNRETRKLKLAAIRRHAKERIREMYLAKNGKAA